MTNQQKQLLNEINQAIDEAETKVNVISSEPVIIDKFLALARARNPELNIEPVINKAAKYGFSVASGYRYIQVKLTIGSILRIDKLEPGYRILNWRKK